MEYYQIKADNNLKNIIESKGFIKLTTYTDSKTKIKIKNPETSEEWEMLPESIRRGKLLPPSEIRKARAERAKNIKDRKGKTVEYFLEELKKVHSEIYKIENIKDYKNLSTNLNFICGKCGKTFNTKPKYLLAGFNCPKCSKNKTSKPSASNTDEFKIKVLNLEGDAYSVLGEYKDQYTKIKMKHNRCRL